MKQAVAPVGTDPHETTDSIVASELLKLRNQREKLTSDNKAYVENHPELHVLIDQFVCACMSSKPTDIVKFGAFFFNDLRKSGGVGPCPVVIAGPSGMNVYTPLYTPIYPYISLYTLDQNFPLIPT